LLDAEYLRNGYILSRTVCELFDVEYYRDLEMWVKCVKVIETVAYGV